VLHALPVGCMYRIVIMAGGGPRKVGSLGLTVKDISLGGCTLGGLSGRPGVLPRCGPLRLRPICVSRHGGNPIMANGANTLKGPPPSCTKLLCVPHYNGHVQVSNSEVARIHP
jgi:hypothetical protein